MSSPMILPGLSDVASSYDAILCDVWGVIHNGRRAFSSACDALVRFRAGGGRVVLITNAPVPKAQVLRYFAPLGVPDEAFDDCVSSGDASRAELENWRGKRVWKLGADEGFEHDRFLYEGVDLAFTSGPHDADLVLCIGLRDHADEHPESYREELRPGAERRTPMLCANPDIQVRVGDRLVWCAGALARIYEDMGGPVVYPGKPHDAIYTVALAKLEALAGSVDRSRILAIGDGPVTDIKGANAQGIDALYVGSGIGDHRGGAFATDVANLMAETGVSARYAMPELSW